MGSLVLLVNRVKLVCRCVGQLSCNHWYRPSPGSSLNYLPGPGLFTLSLILIVDSRSDYALTRRPGHSRPDSFLSDSVILGRWIRFIAPRECVAAFSAPR